MTKKGSSLRIEVEEAEKNLTSLQKKTKEIPIAYEECQKAINREKEIWAQILHYSKGTDSERQVYQRLNELEEKQREVTKVFSIAEEEIEKERIERKAAYEKAELLYEKTRKEDLNENNV